MINGHVLIEAAVVRAETDRLKVPPPHYSLFPPECLIFIQNYISLSEVL